MGFLFEISIEMGENLDIWSFYTVQRSNFDSKCLYGIINVFNIYYFYTFYML